MKWMRVKAAKTWNNIPFDRIFPRLAIVAVTSLTAFVLPVAVHSSPAWACPPGQIEDMKLAVCASEDDDVSLKVTGAPAENEPEASAVSIDKIMMADLQQPYTGREAYLTDDQGSWFLRLEAGSNCTQLYVLKGWPEDGEPAIRNQPWFKRMFKGRHPPQVFYASISDYIEKRAFEYFFTDENGWNGFLTEMRPWGMSLYETETWYRLQIHSNELKRLIASEFSDERLKTVVFYGSNFIVGGDFEPIDAARIKSELARTDEWPRANTDFMCSLIRSDRSELLTETGLSQKCIGTRAKISERRISLNEAANYPKAGAACEALF
jgi:hypothetical protein